MASRPTSRLRRAAVSLIVLAALAGSGYYAWKTWFQPVNPRTLYQIVEVQRGDIEDLVTATGTLQPLDYVDVGAQVSGQLRKIHVEVGSLVERGDLLAEIDPTVLTANVDAARAGLRSLEANLQVREAALALARQQYQRQKNLAAEDATTQDALQSAENTLRSAEAQLAAQKASIEQTQSSLRASEANLNYARIYAPISGVVVSITARQGQTLNANQSAPIILRVADLSTMLVQTQVSEADVGKLRTGMPVYFTTLGSQGQRYHGQLRKVEPTPTVTNNVVLYNALFNVPNTNRALMTSMTAQVFFIAAEARNTLLVPAAAIQGGQRGPRQGQGPGGPRPGGAGGAGGAGGPGAGAASGPAAPAPAPTPIAATTTTERAPQPAPGASSPERAAPRNTRGPDTAAPGGDNRGCAPGGGGGGGARPATTPEEQAARDRRRAEIAAMTDEQRRAFFEQNRRAREAAGGSAPSGDRPRMGPGGGQGGAPGGAPGAGRPDCPPQTAAAGARDAATPAARTTATPAEEQRAASVRTPDQAAAPVNRGLFTGPSGTGQRGPRRATVRVIDAEGRIEERQVEIGLSNRVHVQIISGLKEGDEVIAGVRQTENQPAGNPQRSGLQQGGMPGGMGGMPGGAPGGVRR